MHHVFAEVDDGSRHCISYHERNWKLRLCVQDDPRLKTTRAEELRGLVGARLWIGCYQADTGRGRVKLLQDARRWMIDDRAIPHDGAEHVASVELKPLTYSMLCQQRDDRIFGLGRPGGKNA